MFNALFGKKKSSAEQTESDNDAMDRVEKEIQGSKVVIFSKSYCPYCTQTKSLFTKNYPKVTATVIELDRVKGGADMQAALGRKTGQRTVPNVFVSGEHVGGNDDAHAAFKSGKLQRLLDGKES